MSTPPVIAYDPDTNVISIDGIRYSAEMLRTVGFGAVGKWLRLGERIDGTRNLMGFSADVEAKLCKAAGLK